MPYFNPERLGAIRTIAAQSNAICNLINDWSRSRAYYSDKVIKEKIDHCLKDIFLMVDLMRSSES